MLLLVVKMPQEIASREFYFQNFPRELRAFGARNSGLRPQSAPPFPTTLDPRLIIAGEYCLMSCIILL
jgi:hypothetical protein